ncbi:hypothetical protein LOC70_03820 [Rhodopirellula sp. JC737]|nr:hypothetical protein [Rhodopirellula sp. JC737]
MRHRHVIGACVLLLRIVFAVLGTTAVWMFLSQFFRITPPLGDLIILPTFLLLLLCNGEEALDALRAYTGAAIGFATANLILGLVFYREVVFATLGGFFLAVVWNRRLRRRRKLNE